MITGSAIRKLQAITGLEVKKLSDTCYGLYITPSVALFSFVADEKKACDQLRQQNWQRVSRLAFEKAGWSCQKCHRIRPCEAHHLVYRSRWSRHDGPLDVESNVSVLCSECHSEIHRPAPSASVTLPSDDLNEIDRILESAEREDGQ